MTFANIALTTFVLVGMFFGLPWIYWKIYNETMISNARAVNYKERFGKSLLGAKIDLTSMKKRKFFFLHILSFFIVRLVFLFIAFWTSLGWV